MKQMLAVLVLFASLLHAQEIVHLSEDIVFIRGLDAPEQEMYDVYRMDGQQRVLVGLIYIVGLMDDLTVAQIMQEYKEHHVQVGDQISMVPPESNAATVNGPDKDMLMLPRIVQVALDKVFLIGLGPDVQTAINVFRKDGKYIVPVGTIKRVDQIDDITVAQIVDEYNGLHVQVGDQLSLVSPEENNDNVTEPTNDIVLTAEIDQVALDKVFISGLEPNGQNEFNVFRDDGQNIIPVGVVKVLGQMDDQIVAEIVTEFAGLHIQVGDQIGITPDEFAKKENKSITGPQQAVLLSPEIVKVELDKVYISGVEPHGQKNFNISRHDGKYIVPVGVVKVFGRMDDLIVADIVTEYNGLHIQVGDQISVSQEKYGNYKTRNKLTPVYPKSFVGFSVGPAFPLGEGSEYWNIGFTGGVIMMAANSYGPLFGVGMNYNRFNLNQDEFKTGLREVYGFYNVSDISGSIGILNLSAMTRLPMYADEKNPTRLYLQLGAGYNLTRLNAEVKYKQNYFYYQNQETKIKEEQQDLGVDLGFCFSFSYNSPVLIELVPLYHFIFSEQETTTFITLNMNVCFGGQ